MHVAEIFFTDIRKFLEQMLGRLVACTHYIELPLLPVKSQTPPAHTARRFEAPRFETLEECEEAYDKLLGVRPDLQKPEKTALFR